MCRWCFAAVWVCVVSAVSLNKVGSQEREAGRDTTQTRPVLCLPFDGNLVDASAPQRACTAHGAIEFVDGQHGKCAVFDGQSWIDTGVLQQELGAEFTVECWVRPDKQQNVHADIFGNHDSAGLGFVLQQDGASTNHFQAAYGAGAGKWVLSEAVHLAAGQWQHVALVKTRNGLRCYLNSVLVAETHTAAPLGVSPMRVAVGLGYQAPERCFRGLIDDFRIWNRALTSFEHAGIDAALTRATHAQCLEATPRPAMGRLTRSWTLATDDTRIVLAVNGDGEMTMCELSSPKVPWEWIRNPVAIGLWPQVEVAGQSQAVRWRLVDDQVDQRDGNKVTLRFASEDPALEVVSQWHAQEGPGPVHHSLHITNRSDQTVAIAEQPTFDIDVAGATDMWSFHSDGITPDAVGVYRHPLTIEPVGHRHTVRTAPTGEFIPYVVFDADQRHGIYLGLEWSCCRIETVTLSNGTDPSVRVRAGNIADLHMALAPGESLAIRPGFIGAYCGDLDDAGNSLRRWLMRYCVPDILREDPSYPKVQWNAFGATGKTPGSWDPVEVKYFPWIDDIAPLGFEEVMIDVAWWQGDEPDSDQIDWAQGMKKAADYAHERGLRFGLYWTDNLDMADPAARRQRADRVRRLFHEYGAHMWRSDCTRGEVLGASFAATRGFYDMVDALAAEIPGFQWENCSGGGRIKDYGAMRRAVKIFNSDTYSPLHVRQAFYDSSFALHPIQLEGHLGSTDGRFRPQGVAGFKFAFRSMSMGAPEWFLDAPNGGNGSQPWTQEERDAVKACVDTYKTLIRPLVRQADLYHILPRPDGRNWDGLEYYDPIAGKGVVFLFKPSREIMTQVIRLRGLDPAQMYGLRFEDGTHPSCSKAGSELMNEGVPVTLQGDEASELIFFELCK